MARLSSANPEFAPSDSLRSALLKGREGLADVIAEQDAKPAEVPLSLLPFSHEL